MKFKETMLRLLFPPRCFICGEIAQFPNEICKECQTRLPLLNENLCETCGKPLNSCICHGMNFSFQKIISASAYNLNTRKAIKALKFDTNSIVGENLALMMYEAYLKKKADFQPQFISWVPMEIEQQKKRGHNQAKTLAKNLSILLNLPLLTPPVEKIKTETIQHELNLSQRHENVNRIFKITKEKIEGNIILVDDVVTTGATLEAVSSLLKKAGAKNIVCLTAATTLLRY